MGTTVTIEQNAEAAKTCVSTISSRFGDTGVTVEAVAHTSGKKYEFVRITCSPEQWRGVAKFLKYEIGVNYCAKVTGTHYPEGSAERGWEVAYHMNRWPISNVEAHTMTVLEGEKLKGDDIPMEFEIFIPLASGDSPSVPTIQDIWEGADWNEKETWDLVGIDFEGHKEMRRVLQPHETPAGFHPLQKQHKLRYHEFNEMYDDAQGFMRKSEDIGKVK